ncbi:MBL fold metallo-hydrolase [Acanthopleuribacter pedis]|uniref:MBL fold metallo-hydrolase n=1 Tax=Acanthopleuribacter pedis TaxID=442870 RepID=A0A8J7Q3D7_9BACT|nr:MBL fold metallo-hydrolase [Acanthopleuribacter pedis]
MKFSSVMGNRQKLDGGAMFGNAPKALWSRWVETDELNRIDLACRALLVETENHKILLETGIGAYMAPKFKDRFGIQEDHHVLLDSLKELGVGHEDITVVILSHLHFDHAGGLLTSFEEGRAPELLFPNAAYYVGEGSWDRACSPHPRDRASFIPELPGLLVESGRLNKVQATDVLRFDGLAVHFYESEGHTPGMLLADLRWGGNQRLVFGADLIPGRPWVHLPITMGYDRFPERLIDEKRVLLEALHRENAWLYYTHDAGAAVSKVAFDPAKKKFSADDARETLVHAELGSV